MADPISWVAAKAAEWVAATVFSAASGASLATAVNLANAAYAVTYAAVTITAYAGVAALSRPKIPPPEQGTTALNQTEPYAQWGFGTARISGKRMLWEAFSGLNADVIAIHEGPIEGVVQRYLNDDPVIVLDNVVQTLPDGDTYSSGAIKIYDTWGQTPGTNFAAITAKAGAKWPSDARGDGIRQVGLTFKAVKDADVLKV
ncbi:MAG: hypothetical protein EOP20_06850, partial [Hyphomicrobiales bacterium]